MRWDLRWVRLIAVRAEELSVYSTRAAGVEPLVLAGEVVTPVLIEVAVADQRAQREDGFGAKF